MYSYSWDIETGGLVLNTSPLQFSKEPRLVYSKELDLLGFDKYWNYDKDESQPLMWAEATNYIYRGRLVATVKGGSFYTAPTLSIIEDPEPNNQKIRPIDVDGMLLKNKDILDGLVAETIKNVYNTYITYKEKVDLFHVSYSGGKDSEVTLDIVKRALPHNAFVVIFGDTGMEFPDTYDAVELTKKKCEKDGINFYIAKSHLKPTESWRQFGPPSATIRWCCSIHKTTPQLLLVKDIVGKNSVTEMAFVGVRADESLRRSGYGYVSYGTKHRGQYSCNPILSWNSAEVYLYNLANNIHLNEAYKRGNTRAGCLVCPMATNRNDYINNLCYNSSTKPLLDIIRDLNASDKNDESRLISYIDNNGWKARKNGRDLSISPRDYDESIIGENLVITFKNHNNEWFQWAKTIGNVIIKDSEDCVIIVCKEKQYKVYLKKLKDDYIQLQTHNTNATDHSAFLKKIRIICRKSHYCKGCKVCMANCQFGNLVFDEKGELHISDNCINCGQCLEIDTGCYIYKSLWLSKGLGKMNNKMKSIDCYAGHGPKMEWFKMYLEYGEDFMFKNSLGNNQAPNFYRFLRDGGIIEGNTETRLGTWLRNSNLEDENVWAIMLVNLSYTPEVGWYIRNFKINDVFGQSTIIDKLSTEENVSKSALKSVPSALKRIAALPLSNVGFGFVTKADKENGGARFVRSPWLNPDPRVILYSLYKYAEKCDGYYQFSMSRLYDYNIISEGVSPVQIFGIPEESMKQILTSLSMNYPDYISVSFTHDLDNINLKEGKSANNVLDLF